MPRYVNAPLKFVVFVADLSPAAVLGEAAGLDRIHNLLRDVVPVREDLTNVAIPQADGFMNISTGVRFVDGEQHRAVIVTPSRVSIETTEYSSFTEFSGFLEQVLDAVADVAPGRACRRLGLRYVDEIRIPGTEPGNVNQWLGWLDEGLFPGVALRTGDHRREVAGVVDEVRDNGFGIRFAWHTGNGHAVQPNGPLIVPNPSDGGPYFALDTDSYWTASPGTGILGLGDPALIERVRHLHDPVQDLFEMSLTDRLRNEILQPVES